MFTLVRTGFTREPGNAPVGAEQGGNEMAGKMLTPEFTHPVACGACRKSHKSKRALKACSTKVRNKRAKEVAA